MMCLNSIAFKSFKVLTQREYSTHRISDIAGVASYGLIAHNVSVTFFYVDLCDNYTDDMDINLV